MKVSEVITEGRQHPVICVDVQPEYCIEADVCKRIIDFVAVKQTGPVLMFVNAEDQGLTADTISDIRAYWDDTVCPEQDRYSYDSDADDYQENPNCTRINWRRFEIVDKGYGYFRSWMDYGINPASIIRVIRLMYQQRVSDSRELFGGSDSDQYQEGLEKLLGSDFESWMLTDGIQIHWTSVAQLKRYSGAYLVGGGRNECLREVELLMNAFNIGYKRIDSLVYG